MQVIDRFRTGIRPLTRRRGARITPFHGPPEGGFFRSPCRGLEFMSQSASAKGPHAKADAISSPPQSAVMGTYARQDVVFKRGEGCWLTSTTELRPRLGPWLRTFVEVGCEPSADARTGS